MKENQAGDAERNVGGERALALGMTRHTPSRSLSACTHPS